MVFIIGVSVTVAVQWIRKKNKAGKSMERTKRSIVASVIMIFVLSFGIVGAFVPQETYAASAKLNKTKVSITKGNTYKLKVSGGKVKKNSWKSSNKKVATVSQSGKVTAKKAGTAKITCKVGTKKLTCKVTVKKIKGNGSSICSKTGKVHRWAMYDPDYSREWFALGCAGCGKLFTDYDDVDNAQTQLRTHKWSSDCWGTTTEYIEYGTKCVCVDCGKERKWENGIPQKKFSLIYPFYQAKIPYSVYQDLGYKKVTLTSSDPKILEITKGTFFDVVFTEKTQKCYYLTGKKSGTAKVTVKSNGKTMEVMTVKVVKEE